jgi:hypothetical protein
MRTTLNVPDELIRKVQKLSGEKSKTRAITVAMEEYIRQKKAKDLLALKGNVALSFDWRAEEERELKGQQRREGLLEKRKG